MILEFQQKIEIEVKSTIFLQRSHTEAQRKNVYLKNNFQKSGIQQKFKFLLKKSHDTFFSYDFIKSG